MPITAVFRPTPRPTVTAIARIRGGNARIASIDRIETPSAKPPKAPAPKRGATPAQTPGVKVPGVVVPKVGPPIVGPPAASGTVVTVTTGVPVTYTFKLASATQPRVVSDRPAVELTVPSGEVTFNVTNPSSNILPHDFEVCTTPLPGPLKTLAEIQTLPNSCSGVRTPVLSPGSATATIEVDLTTPGTYEYLSTVGGASGDAFSGMKGVLNVT